MVGEWNVPPEAHTRSDGQEFFSFHGARQFITMFTKARK
jgi:hypothetical protein